MGGGGGLEGMRAWRDMCGLNGRRTFFSVSRDKRIDVQVVQEYVFREKKKAREMYLKLSARHCQATTHRRRC